MIVGLRGECPLIEARIFEDVLKFLVERGLYFPKILMKLLERKRLCIVGIGLHSSGSIRHQVVLFSYDGVVIDDVLSLAVNGLKLAHIFYFTTINSRGCWDGKGMRMRGKGSIRFWGRKG